MSVLFPLTELDHEQLRICTRTISANTFYMMTGDALVSKESLSVVRMGDGEVQLLKAIGEDTDSDELVDSHKPEWLLKLGLTDITKGTLSGRLHRAANDCDYFAPSVTGIIKPGFHLHSLFDRREEYVDNFFVNAWSEEMKIELFKEAKHVLFIHRSISSADALQIRAKYGLDVKVTYLPLRNWSEAGSVIAKANQIDAPLVLFSGGPGSKFIGPAIAVGGNIPKVALDLGNTADSWLLNSLKDIPAGRR